MEKDIKKQLTLKYKQVQRLIKEYNSYTKEIDKINLGPIDICFIMLPITPPPTLPCVNG